jgi:hypothetical protein
MRTLKSALFLLLLFCVVATSAHAQKLRGNVLSKKFGEKWEMKKTYLSHDGKYAVLEFDEALLGISVEDGTVLWERKLKDDHEYKGGVIRWLSNTEVIVPTDKHLEFITFPDGATIASIERLDKGEMDFMHEESEGISGFDSRIVKRRGNVLLVPYDGGFQLIDLKNRKELYKAADELDEFQWDIWKSYGFIRGDFDDFVLLDHAEPRVIKVFKDGTFRKGGPEILNTVFQVLLVERGFAAVVFEEAIAVFNVQTGDLIGEIILDIDDVDNYWPVYHNDRFKLMIQIDDQLALYDVGTAKREWGVRIKDNYGIMMQAWRLDDDLLVSHMDDDDYITVDRVSGKDGKTLWSKRLTHSEEEFEAHIKYKGNVDGAVASTGGMRGGVYVSLGSSTTSTPWSLGKRSYSLDSLGYQTYHSQRRVDPGLPYTEDQFLDLLAHTAIHPESDAFGLVRCVGSIGTDVAFFAHGMVHHAVDRKESTGKYDGEGLIILDGATGNVVKFVQAPHYRESDSYDNRQTTSVMPMITPRGTLIIGSQSVTFIHTDGTLDTIGINTEKPIIEIDAGVNYVTITYEEYKTESWVTEQIVIDGPSIQRNIMGVGTHERVFRVFEDTTFATVTLRYVDGRIDAYDVLHELPSKWGKPKWTLTEDKLDDLDLGDLEVENAKGVNRGIFIHKDFVFCVGTDGFGVIDINTGCAKSVPWNGYDPDRVPKKMDKKDLNNVLHYFRPLGKGAVVDLGKDVAVLKLASPCSIETIGYGQIDRDEVDVDYSPVSNIVVITDANANRIDVFKID